MSNSREGNKSGESECKDNFLSIYHAYTESNTEAPKLFHTWCAICGIAAMLGKNFWFTRGHFKVHPNLYVMLIGSPGTGKGTAINILFSLMQEAGYRTFAANRSSKEKFLLDLQEGFAFDDQGLQEISSVFNINDFIAADTLVNGLSKEVFIIAEEFNDFIGNNNSEFIALLTQLWSFNSPPAYTNRLKNSRSVNIWNPCVNLLGGNTSAGFSIAFPPEIIGQGFLSRLLPIYGEPTGRKISFPTIPSSELRGKLTSALKRAREEVHGEAGIEEGGRELLDKINQSWTPISDGRFQHYTPRRFNQLIKLCMVQAAFRGSSEISCQDIKDANTILTYTEDLMPKAIGEFGKAKNSDANSKIMEALYSTHHPLSTQDIWKIVRTDLNSIAELANILSGLVHAEKIQSVAVGKEQKWLPKLVVGTTVVDYINPEFKKTLQ